MLYYSYPTALLINSIQRVIGVDQVSSILTTCVATILKRLLLRCEVVISAHQLNMETF
jgi:hypothetical protein